MASTVVKLNLFIASPYDVSAERAVVREICESLCKDEIIKGHGLMIEAVGWEEIYPQPGRPQEIINRLVVDCDIFVCIFYRRFGTPTGVADSGTHEEFLLAVDHWKNLKKPQIFFYFKDVQIRSLKDLENDQLRKVFKLKEQIENEHTLIYSPFQDTDQFRDKISSDLKKWIAKTKPWDIVPATKNIPIIPDSPEQYLKWVADKFGYVEAEKLQAKGNAIPLKLPEIFIPLYTYDFESEKIKRAEEEHPQVLMDDIYEIIDIETLILQYDYLFIEGQSGSGKTTVLKHFAYMLTGENGEAEKPDGMEGYIPILIFLKDLNSYFDNSGNLDVNDIISWYLKKTGGDILNADTIYEYLKMGKIVLLIDGLDELRNEYRDIVVNLFADLRFKHKGVKTVLSSRPHGIEGAAINRFGDRHAKLLALDMEQISLFINKWFSYIYSGSTVTGWKNAETMISEIKSHPAISDLVNNPLILTAVCILYYNNKELPGQRAELYQKLIENLLHRRFQEPILVHEFLKNLAFKMHESGVRSVDKNYAIDVLKGIIKRIPGENDLEYRTRLEKEFSYIEPRCGLLLFENGQYMFWHLSFQEFLTAHYLVSNRSDYIEAIYNYWDDDWYKEVVELFIGFLGIENTKTANDIIFHALNGNDSGDFKKWRLASKSFLSLEKGKRAESTEQKSREKMIEILDKSLNPKVLADAGELLGWTGDPRDLKEFVCIEGGIYDLEGFGKTEITTFDIGKYPVTNGWYEEFIIDGGYGNNDFWSEQGKQFLEYSGINKPLSWDDRKWKCPNSPVVGISLYEATAFTKWLSQNSFNYFYSLPEEKEWQAAAAGFSGREYPWGDDSSLGQTNNKDAGIEKISPVGIFKSGATPDGIFNLSGNIWEWTNTDYRNRSMTKDDFLFEEDIYKLLVKRNYEKIHKRYKKADLELIVVRGGSFWGTIVCPCTFNNRYFPPVNRRNYIGFRCMRRRKQNK